MTRQTDFRRGISRVTKPSDDIFTNVHSLPPTGGIRLEGDREGKIFSGFLFNYRKKSNIYVSVQRVVRSSHQSDRVGYVSRTNQIAALGYVSRTNQIAALGYVSSTKVYDHFAPWSFRT